MNRLFVCLLTIPLYLLVTTFVAALSLIAALLVTGAVGYLRFRIGLPFVALVAVAIAITLLSGWIMAKRSEKWTDARKINPGFVTLILGGIVVALALEGGAVAYRLLDTIFTMAHEVYEIRSGGSFAGLRPDEGSNDIAQTPSPVRTSRLAFLRPYGDICRGELLITLFITITSLVPCTYLVFSEVSVYTQKGAFAAEYPFGVSSAFSCILALVLGVIGYGYTTRLVSAAALYAVYEQKDYHHHQMQQMYKAHQNNTLGKAFMPNDSIANYAAALEDIDEVKYCSPGFRAAFNKYTKAWVEFGRYVKENTGLPGMERIYTTKGLSLFEGWFVRIPTLEKELKDAEDNLKRVAEHEDKGAGMFAWHW